MTETPIQDKRIEMKYMLDAKLSADVRQWAREHLGVDQHCSDSISDSYEVNTLYLDTPNFDLFNRTWVVGRSKHRIRRYGDESTLWVESKRKKGNVVRKNRTAASEAEVFSRLSAPSGETTWCGEWFSQRLYERQLQPAVQVYYRRFARTAVLDGESLRLTIDSHLQGSPACGWSVPSAANSDQCFRRLDAIDGEILELKFHNQMPHHFKELLRTFAIPATGFSKYRTAVEAAGVAHLPSLFWCKHQAYEASA